MDLFRAYGFNIEAMLIMFSRLSGFFTTSPFYSNKFVFNKAKILLLIVTSLALSMGVDYGEVGGGYSFVITILVEFMAGLIMGFVASGFIYLVNFVGDIVDNQAGFGMLKSAGIGNQVSGVSARLLEYTALVLLFLTKGHLYFIYVVAHQGSFYKLYSVFKSNGLIDFVIEFFEFIIKGGLNIALPFIFVFLTIDISLGMVNKAFQRFNVFLFSLPLKIGAYFIILLYYVYFFVIRFGNIYDLNMDMLTKFISFGGV